MPTAAPIACRVCHRIGCTVHERRPFDRNSDDKRLSSGKTETARRKLFKRSPWCVLCLRDNRFTIATIRDHIVPLSEGGTDTDDNTQALCVACHDQKSARENVHGKARASAGAQYPRVGVAITVVCGAAGTGKTAYVERHRRPGDLVWDLDAIADVMAQCPTFPRPSHVVDCVLFLRSMFVQWLRSHRTRAYVIVTNTVDAQVLASELHGDVVECRADDGADLRNVTRDAIDAKVATVRDAEPTDATGGSL